MLESSSLAHGTWSERLLTVFVWLVAGMAAGVFFVFLGNILLQGTPGFGWSFLLSPPLNAGRAGGVHSILVSTGLLLGVCMSVALPIGLSTAILLGEFVSRDQVFGRLVRGSLEVLAGVPSIVFGLFGNAFFSKTLGLGFSIYSGGLTLACMVLPILIRSTEEGLRSVPAEYRWSGEALALSRFAILRHLLLPAALPGLMVGLALGIGRALAETAALIFTSGYVDRMPRSLSDSGRSLSLHIYDLSMNVPGGDANAYKSALTLVILVLVINGAASLVAKRWIRHKRRA